MFLLSPMRHAFIAPGGAAVDKNEIMYEYAFPRLADYDIWRAMPRVRHSKYPTYLMVDDYASHREMTARHVVRAAGPPAGGLPRGHRVCNTWSRRAPRARAAPRPDGGGGGSQPIKAYRFPHVGGGAARELPGSCVRGTASGSPRSPPDRSGRSARSSGSSRSATSCSWSSTSITGSPRAACSRGGRPCRWPSADAAVDPPLAPRPDQRPGRLGPDDGLRRRPDARLADPPDEHPVLCGDALDPPPQPPHGQRCRLAAHVHDVLPDAEPLRRGVFARRFNGAQARKRVRPCRRPDRPRGRSG